ncbi:MAG: SGNH/GDSL hydrolase family protein [Gammaproteobacteria bacterium]|nr:SGNH/GDSL hydrolase family protein [Gammaproteobacteria bacterium]MBA3731153.1 SGNH/GDSL hydrolase family protein [Gammaproteobacteria bacterium]
MNRIYALALGLLISLTPALGWTALANRDGNSGSLDYVAFGASDAAGIGAIPLTEGYVYKVADVLAVRGQPVALYNLGIPGATAPDIKDAVEVFLLGQQDADLITLWTGANDIIQGVTAAEFRTSLRSILSQLRANTSAAILVANLVKLNRLPRFVDEPNPRVTPARVATFNRIIHAQAAVFRAPVVNLFGDITPGDAVTSDLDGFHPNNLGHRRIAALFLRKIIPRL